MRDFIITFISVNPKRVEKYCEETGKQFTQSDDFLNTDELKKIIFMDLIGLAKEN